MTGADLAPVTGDDAPRRAPHVAWTRVDDEAVLFEPGSGMSTVLNVSAATVWSLLDGSVTLATLAAEIADVHDIDAAEVAEQLVAMASDLVRRGLAELTEEAA